MNFDPIFMGTAFLAAMVAAAGLSAVPAVAGTEEPDWPPACFANPVHVNMCTLNEDGVPAICERPSGVLGRFGARWCHPA